MLSLHTWPMMSILHRLSLTVLVCADLNCTLLFASEFDRAASSPAAGRLVESHASRRARHGAARVLDSRAGDSGMEGCVARRAGVFHLNRGRGKHCDFFIRFHDTKHQFTHQGNSLLIKGNANFVFWFFLFYHPIVCFI